MYKVVFHVDEMEKWDLSLSNVANLLAATKDPIKIAVVANSVAVQGYGKENYGELLEKMVALNGDGVVFSACQNALRAQKMGKESLATFVKIVPAGVLELVQLQQEGYSYIKP